MSLHPPTFFMAALLVLGLISGLLALAWLQNREVKALAWWSLSFLLAAAGFAGMLIGGESVRNPVREVSNAVILVGYGLSFMACRQFNQRPTRLWVVFGGSLIWLFCCWGIDLDAPARMKMAALLCGVYTFAMAYELWFGAPMRLLAQRAAALLCVLHGLYFALRFIGGPALLRSIPSVENVDSTWILLLSIETLVYATSFSFLLVSMAKEQIEARHRQAALQDPLTGIANRRAFKEGAERRLRANQQAGRTSSILLMDLDHFKAINDKYGHDGGDQVLTGFTALVSSLLEPDDLFCRMGGEEFALFLSDTSTDHAVDVAESIRALLAVRGLRLNEGFIPATVSIGVVSSRDPHATLRTLLTRADEALYAAKAGGRNRVEVHKSSVLDVVLASDRGAA